VCKNRIEHLRTREGRLRGLSGRERYTLLVLIALHKIARHVLVAPDDRAAADLHQPGQVRAPSRVDRRQTSRSGRIRALHNPADKGLL